MRIFSAVITLFFICGCANVEKGDRPSGAKVVVERAFVERLDNPKSFDFFAFWNLSSVEDSFDAPMREVFEDFKATCKRVYPRWGTWGNGSEAISPVFSVQARNDPLTMCAHTPHKAQVTRVKEDASSAVYRVTYTLPSPGSVGQFYKAASTVSLVNKDGQWLVSEASNTHYGNTGGKTYTFASRLNELSKLLEQSQ